MKRAFERLDERSHDLLVIGGGVYGAWVAYDAVLRGLKVALVEREDWGSGTSQSSSKLIHGGLRYLEYGQLGLVRKTLAERRLLLRLAPHRVRPLRFILPIYRRSRRGRWMIGLGLRLYDFLAGPQSGGRHHRLDEKELFDKFSFINNADLVGGFTYGDAQTDDARFTLEIAAGAARAGARVVNHAEALELKFTDGRVTGAVVRDRETDRTIDLKATVTVLATGPWNSELLGAAAQPIDPGLRLAKGVHLVMPALPARRGVLVLTRKRGRVTFLLPWYGRTLLGTTDTEYRGDPAKATVESAEVEQLLGQANSVLNGVHWKRADIISAFAGVRALPAGRKRHKTSSISREFQFREPVDGLLVPIGGKFTSARLDSIPLVDRVEKILGHTPRPSQTGERPFPWRPEHYGRWRSESLSEAMSIGLDEEVAQTAGQRYGKRLDRLLTIIRENPELANRIVPDLPFVWGEIPLAIAHEMALRLDDVVRRRIPLGLLARLEDGTMEAIARMMQGLLGWSDSRVEEELIHARSKLAVLEV